jgi:uncharacterized membrane protein
MTSSASRARATLTLVAIVAAAAILRFIALGHGLWYDEIVTLVEAARLPFRQIATEFAGLNSHPLYSLLAHASFVLFGESGWALRLPAAIFGIASVAMVYVFARSFLSNVEALAAAAVIATSYHHVWFSQNARGYTLMGCLTLVSTHFLLRAMRENRTSHFAIYIVAAVAGVYTHLTMAFVIVGHSVVLIGGWLIGWRETRDVPIGRFVVAWIVAGVASAAAYAPFVGGILELMGRSDTKQAAQVATAGWALLEALRALILGTGVPAALLGAAFAGLGALSMLRRWPLTVAILAMPAVVTGIALAGLSQPIRPRFFFFLSAAAAVFVGRGIGAAVEWTSRTFAAPNERHATAGIAGVTSVLVALSAIALPTAYRVPKQDFDHAVPRLVAEENAGAAIVLAGPMCLPVQTYYSKPWSCLKTMDDWRRAESSGTRVLVGWTLGAYIEDANLRAQVLGGCPVVATYPGTLGGGDITICAMGQRSTVSEVRP